MVEGYKNTEVGIIPNDWNLSPIGTYARLINGRAYAIHEWENQGVPVIRLQNLTGSGSVYYYSNLKLPERQYCHYDDLLFMWSATFGPIIWKGEKAIYHYHIWKVETDDEYLDKWYLYHVLNELTERVKQNSTNGGTMLHLTKGSMIQMQIPLPPTKAEQTAIATALNDADALISQLEKLISKKKAIRQATVMELLTGRKRLDGFNDKWINEELPKVCWYQEGPGLRNWQFTKSGIKVINVTNLVNGFLNLDRTARHISLEEFHKMYEHFEIDENDIVVASSGNSYGKVSVVRKQDLPLLMNTSVIRFKPLKGINYNFLLAFLKSYLFKDQIDLLTTGGAQPNFGPAHLKKIVISLPKSPEEQKAIGEILSNVDLEIVGLEVKLEKQKQLKQGMMQSLLTGKIRLV